MTHTSHTSTDLRVQRTRRLIQEALIELTIQKGFAAVTVRDITRRARVNRATFYRHFQDKFDLLDQYAEEVYQLLDAAAEADSDLVSKDSEEDRSVDGLTQMFEHIRTHGTFYRVMLGKNGDPAFAEKMRRYISRRMRLFLPEALVRDERSADLCLSYISSGSVGALVWWLEHGMPYTPAEMAAISRRLSSADLSAVLSDAAGKGA